jgi:Bacterial membrane protein YfhO
MLGLAPQKAQAIDQNYPAFQLDTVRAVILAVLLLGLVLALKSGRLRGTAWATVVGALVLLDLWSGERRQIIFGPPAAQQFAADGVVNALQGDSTVFRVLRGPMGCYTDNYLMLYGINGLLGYQGTEIHAYDELLGGKCEWRHLTNPNVWQLLAVKYLVLAHAVQHPALTLVGDGPVPSQDGTPMYVYQYKDAQPFARVVAQAFKAPDAQVPTTLIDPRFDPRRILLVPPSAPIGVSSLSALPDTVADAVHTRALRPGAYRFELAAPAPDSSYLFVSENYYPAWHARVDGVPEPVVRAQMSLMAVPLAKGSRVVELTFQSQRYVVGRTITLLTVLLVVALLGYGWVVGRRRHGAGEGRGG